MLIGKGWAGALDDVAVTIHPRVQRACLAPFTAPGLRGIFAPDHVRIETTGGRRVNEHFTPPALFAGHRLETRWDALHLAYFTAYAM
jgi:hypothetical protein